MMRPDDQQAAMLLPMKWNAWVDAAAAKPLSDGIRALRSRLGVDGATTPDIEAQDVELRPSALTGADSEGLAEIVRSRLLPCRRRGPTARAGGKSTLDLLRRKDSVSKMDRRGAPAEKRRRDRRDPAVLLRPRDRNCPVRRRNECGRRPRSDPRRFQGGGLPGSAPPGGAAFTRRGLRRSRTRRRAHRPRGRRLLAERGFSLGHFPQSFQFATIGGFAATRSSGQDSAGYGRFNDMVRGLRTVPRRAYSTLVAPQIWPPALTCGS